MKSPDPLRAFLLHRDDKGEWRVSEYDPMHHFLLTISSNRKVWVIQATSGEHAIDKVAWGRGV